MLEADSDGRSGAALRLDVWLWAARFFKTRQLAKAAIEGGKVELDHGAAKASRQVSSGDRLIIRREQERFEIEVLAVSARRGPASAAQQLYRESAASITARAVERERRSLEHQGMQAPPGKPDKRARRLIRALGDIDAL